jgi:hypothetical protein
VVALCADRFKAQNCYILTTEFSYVLVVVLRAGSRRPFTTLTEWALDTGSVYCEVRTEFKYAFRINFCYIKARAMSQPFSLWPITLDVRVRSQILPCEVCCGQNGTGISFSSGTYVFHCRCHSTNAPYSSLSTLCSYQKDKRANPGNLLKKQRLLGNRGGIE